MYNALTAEQELFLRQFIVRWYAAENKTGPPEYYRGNHPIARREHIDSLTTEFRNYLDANRLPQWSADDLLADCQLIVRPQRLLLIWKKVNEPEVMTMRKYIEVQPNYNYEDYPECNVTWEDIEVMEVGESLWHMGVKVTRIR